MEFSDITYALLEVYNDAVFTNEFAVIENVLIVPEMLARPAFNSVFAQTLSDQTAVTADMVPVLTVLALTKLTMFAEAALIALIMLAEPPDKVVLAVIVPPTKEVFATIHFP